MIDVRQTEEFARWLRDRSAQSRIGRRLVRVAAGLFGDVKPVGDGIAEIRVDAGPGYRIYYVRDGDIVVVLLCGGDKNSQSRDIARAKFLARQLREP